MEPIIPIFRREPFDDPAWTFELKYDGFRGIADTVNGRMLSKNLNPMWRYQSLLQGLPSGCVFDGEIAVLDEAGRPRFNALLFHRSIDPCRHTWLLTCCMRMARTCVPGR